MSRAVLITGATGKQGGAVINALLNLNANFEILALTRNTQSGGAQKLAKKSDKIKLVEGDMNQPEEVFRKAKEIATAPIWGVFSVQVAMGNGQSSATEEVQGKALIDASLNNGVKFFVYTSVDRGGEKSIDTPTDIPHFISKHNVEHYLYQVTAANDMAWCVLRPTAFYDNLTPDFFGKAFATWWDMALKGKKLQLIAASDIGMFAAKAFMDPEGYKGRRISLAGDELTFEEMGKIFKEVTGKEIQTTWRWLAAIMMWMIKEIGYMFRWFREHGYGANIEELKKEHPGLKNFRTWLETESGFVQK